MLLTHLQLDRSRTNSSPTINFQIHTRDKLALIRTQIRTQISDISRIRQPSQRHIAQKLLDILISKRHTDKTLKQSRPRQQRTQSINSDLILAKLRRETLRRLSIVSAPIHTPTFSKQRGRKNIH